MKRAYFDYQAASPVDPRVVEAMTPYFGTMFGNPSSTHGLGQEAKAAIEEARTRVASLVGARKKEEVTFTSGATESNNLALIGISQRNREKGDVLSLIHISEPTRPY